MANQNSGPLSSYQCIVLSDTQPKIRITANLCINPQNVNVSADTVKVQLPLHRLTIRRGGANNKLFFLNHPDYPESTIITRDKGVIAALSAVADEELLEQLCELKLADRLFRNPGVRWMIFFLTILGLLVIARTPATKLAADIIPRSWERMLGKAVFMAVSSSTKMLDDAEIASALQKELEPLLAVTAKSGYTFEFHISRELDTNAFALPGGILVINAGTILKSSRAEELLGVVAHEMAHVTNRHSTRQIITVLGLYAVADIVFGGTIGMIAAGGQGAVYLLRQGFSRDQEREADREGLQYLKEARVDPFGLVEFFTKVREEQQRIPLVGSVEQYVGFLNTHPGTDERIDYLKNQIIAGGEREILPRDTGTFISLQERVKKSLGLGEQQK